MHQAPVHNCFSPEPYTRDPRTVVAEYFGSSGAKRNREDLRNRLAQATTSVLQVRLGDVGLGFMV